MYLQFGVIEVGVHASNHLFLDICNYDKIYLKALRIYNVY